MLNRLQSHCLGFRFGAASLEWETPDGIGSEKNLGRQGQLFSFLFQRGIGAWTLAATAESPIQAAQRRIDAGLAVRIMRLSTWTASATSPP